MSNLKKLTEENWALREALHEAVRIADRISVALDPGAPKGGKGTLSIEEGCKLAAQRCTQVVAFGINDMAKKFGIDTSDCPSVKP